MEEQEIPIKWEVVGYGDNKIVRCYYRHSRYAENPIQDGKWYKDYPMPKTYILKFDEIVDDETREEISSALNPEWTSFTPFNDKILLMGNPQGSTPGSAPVNGIPGTVLEIKHDLSNFFKYTDRKPYSFPSQGNIALYDIEVEFDEEFPNPLTPGNRINMISMIKMVGGTLVCYFLHLYKINQLNMEEYPMEIVDLAYDHEKDLIITFFELLSGVDYGFSYNGDSFDMPYLLTRAQMYYLKIKIDNNIIIPKFESRYLGFGYEDKLLIKVPGVEFIDLIHYFRKFYPNMINHKLNTVSKKFINAEKIDMNMKLMKQYVQNQDPAELAILAKYSIYDSILLYDMIIKLDLLNNLFRIGNLFNSTISNILLLPSKSIISNFLTSIDTYLSIANSITPFANSITPFANSITPFDSFYFPPSLGYYKNVHVYNYSQLLYNEIVNFLSTDRMVLSEEQLLLLNDIKDTGNIMSLITEILDEESRLRITQEITNLAALYHIISINSSEMWMVLPLGPSLGGHLPEPLSGLTLKEVWSELTVVSPTSYIVGTRGEGTHSDGTHSDGTHSDGTHSDGMKNERQAKGLSEICRPPFLLLETMISKILDDIYMYGKINNKLLVNIINDLNSDINNFMIKQRLNYPPSKKTESLYNQYINSSGKTITTWVMVDYVKTTMGDKLFSTLNATDIIDTNYYINKLKKIYLDLSKLPVNFTPIGVTAGATVL